MPLEPRPAEAGTLLADFDSFTEGQFDAVIEDGGIVFSDLDVRIPDDPIPGVFTIDDAGGLLGPEHSPPNVVSTNAFAPGPGVVYNRFGSASITFDSMLANGASIDVFGANVPSNELTLQALLGGVLVGEDTISLHPFPGEAALEWHQTLEVSSVTFDSLRLVASGPQEQGVSFIVFDNVQVALVPEPSTAGLLAAGLLGLAWRRRRSE